MKKIKNNFRPMWLIAPVIVIAWMLVIYFIKGIYPFGETTLIAYDLRQGNLPAMYYVYDAWHSGDFSRLFYDFTTAGGFSREIIFTLLQPRFLFTLFWERENLTYATDLFFVISFALIAFSASYSFSKLFPKLAAPWVVMISVMYAFNGFNLLYLTNIDWLDTVMLYPLIILFALNMMKGKSKVPFFIVMTYTLTLNTYMAFFVVLSLLIFGGLYIFVIERKETRKTAVLNLGIGTGVSLLASGYAIVSYAISMLRTARVGEGAYVLDGYTGFRKTIEGTGGILSAPNEIDIVAVFMFLGTALAIASLIVLWVHFKKDKESRKYTVFFTITIVTFVLQIVFKSVMLIWHLGSYQKFPFRNGFMVSFFCCCIIAYYYSRFGSLEGVKTKFSVLNIFTFVPAFLAAIVIASYADIFLFTLETNFTVLNGYVKYQTGCLAYPYTCFAVAAIICFLLIKLISFKALRNSLSFILVMVLLGINLFGLVAYIAYPNEPHIYKKEFDLRDNFKQEDILSRVGNADGLLIMNYPYVTGTSAISNWTHTLPGDHLKAFSDLGFYSYFTYVYDVGGTVFSRALLHITDTVSESKLDKDIYSEYKESPLGMKYYKNKYKLPIGTAFDKSLKDVNIDNYDNLFEYQNAVYNSLNGEGDLFERVEYKTVSEKVKKEDVYVNKEKEDGSGKGLFVEKKEVTTTTFTFDVGEKSVLYLHKNDKDVPISFYEMTVNGEKYHIYDGVSTIDNSGEFNTEYPTKVNDGILEVGIFENEPVKVTIKFGVETGTTETVSMYLMNLDKMNQLCETVGDNEYSVVNGNINVTTCGNQGDIAFIPISYDEHWKCTVNGNTVEPVCVLGNFMGVEIENGENEIAMEFSHSEGYIKLLLTIAGVLLGVIVLFVEKRLNIPQGVYTLVFIAFTIIFVGAVAVIYIVPTGWSVVSYVISLCKG